MDKNHLHYLIERDYTHKHYNHVVALAEKYKKHITGVGLSELLQKSLHESKDMFEQRKEQTKHINKALAGQVITAFNRVFRIDPNFTIESKGEKITAVFEKLEKYTGTGNLHQYLSSSLINTMFCDPNAWLLNTFSNFDNKTERATPMPMVIPSANAVDYSFHNDMLEYVITKFPLKYLEDNREVDGNVYVMYLPDISVKYTQVSKDYNASEGEDVVTINKMRYVVKEYEHTSKIVPMEIVGYLKDPATDLETYVSPIDPGMPYLEKLLKVVSEMDLTMALDAFPQKTAYVDSCKLKPDNTCTMSGQLKDSCTICGGTGAHQITTVQEARYLKLPSDAAEMVDLSKLTHYDYPPIEIIRFQDEYIDKISDKFHRAIFNSDTYTKADIAKTATGEGLDMQAVYDTLYPFARKVSAIARMVATSTAYYLDYKEPVVAHSFPKDFKLKSFADLMDDLNKAVNSGAGAYVISALQMDIIDCLYADNPTMRKAIRLKHKTNPFSGKTANEIAVILSSESAREIDVKVYTYLEQIFNDLEQEHPELYSFKYDKIRGLVYKKAESYNTEITPFS